jgi:hypothetical protein
MKAFAIGTLIVLACSFFGQRGQAQYKAPSSYLPKNFPARGNAPAAATNSNALDKSKAAKPQQPRFKDLPVNTGFYFLSDTNRTYLWTKTSTSQARNTKNGVVQNITGEAPVQK